MSLLDRVKVWQGNLDQHKAVKWLQESIGDEKQRKFAGLYRNVPTDLREIDFVDVFRFYAALDHQNVALRWLEVNTGEKVLKEFYRLYDRSVSVGIEIKLPVKFFSQLDNYTMPDRTCNSSSCAMVVNYLNKGVPATDDEYLRTVLRYGDTTDHGAQTKAIKEYGLASEWRTDLDYRHLDEQLRKGIPVPIGILHRGSLKFPTGGHICVIVGKTKDNLGYFVHDPYGSVNDAYTGPVSNGKFAVYSKTVLNSRWLCDGANSGWGRIFH